MRTSLGILACTLGIITNGCSHIKKNKPLPVDTGLNSPIRMHIYKYPNPFDISKILILPPLGIADQNMQNHFHHQLFSAAQRRFTTPLNGIWIDSAYAPYIQESNLVCNDGTLNIHEITIVGELMNASHIICPYVYDFKPYHPQRIGLRITVVDAETKSVYTELSGVFDARESDMVDYFMQYCMIHKDEKETRDDLRFKIKSPTTFQAFVADMCTSAMARRLPF